MQKQSFGVTIGGVKHIVTAINLMAGLPSTVTAKIGRVHRIQIIDRSYSMAYELDSVVDQSKQSVSIMDSGDLVSTFWFSSPGQNGHVVMGASPGNDVLKLLEGMRHPVGSTCFSEVMEKVEAAVIQIGSLVDSTVIDLFTDGMPCVPWGTAEEQSRVVKAVAGIVEKGNVSAFNTIGYGSYYDREFLNKLAEMSEFGAFTHTSNIKDFYATIEHNMKVSQNFVVQKTEVRAPADAEILYLSLGNTMRLFGSTMSLSRLDAGQNMVYVVTPGASAKQELLVNGEAVAIGEVDKASTIEKEDFLFAYASESFRKGEHLKAVDILANNVRDKRLATAVFSAFTVSEIGEAQTALTAAVNDMSLRFTEGKTGPGFMPAKDALCVMDILADMIESDDEVYYLPLNGGVPSYSRVGRKAVDAENRFTPKTYDLRAPVSELVWHKEKLNLSLRFTRDGTLSINPRAAKDVGLEPTKEIFTWQSHSFVKDGNVNVKQAAFLVPNGLYNHFVEKGVKMQIVDATGAQANSAEDKDGKTYFRVIVDFAKLPIVNRMYIDKATGIESIYKAAVEIKQVEALQKVVKFLLDEVKDSNANMLKTGAFEGLNAEQIRVLTEHGMREDGSYGGVAKTVASVEDSDSYEARFIAFDVKGASALPSIDEMLEMKEGKTKEVVENGRVVKASKAKATNLPGKYMIDAWDHVQAEMSRMKLSVEKPTVELRNFLSDLLKLTKIELNALRNELNVLKLAKTLTGDGFKGLEPNKAGQLEYTGSKADAETMVIKITRKPVPIDMAA